MGGHLRRGWRETLLPGIYRAHKVSCRSTRDRKPGRRCQCPFELKAPGMVRGTTRTVTFYGSKSEAVAERRRLLAAGRAIGIVNGDGTLRDLAGDYFRAKAPLLAGATIRNRDDDYRLRIEPALGDLLLGQVTRERIAVWVASLAARSSSRRMLVQTVATLRVILEIGVEWGRLPANPARGIRLPRHDHRGAARGVRRVLTREQLDRLFDVGTRSVRGEVMLRLAGEAGLRKGEIIGLRWSDIDADARRIEVHRSVWQERRNDGPRKIEKSTKGNRSRRVAISSVLAQRLLDLRSSAPDLASDSLVLPGRSGLPMGERAPNHMLERAQRRAGLLRDDDTPIVSFHGLRHTAASIMLSEGVPLTIVSRQLGHANPNITATIYAHLLGDEELDRAASVFESKV